MNRQKFTIIMCLAMLVIALWGIGPPSAKAMPMNPVDETKVPHYFGPYPNWGLSQLPVVTPGTCSATTTTACTTDYGCPTGETCVGVTVAGGIKKFVDGLPGLCDPSIAGSCTAAANNLGQYIPLAVPDTTTFAGDPTRPDADYYVIAVVQHRERMSSSLHPNPLDVNGRPVGTLLREYVQLFTPYHALKGMTPVPLMTDLPDGTSVPTLMPDGSQALGVDAPHYLGPVIAATKDKPVRIVFYNLLPTGSGGNLFLPVDSTIMGSGMGPMTMGPPLDTQSVMDEVRNPMCSEDMKGTGTGCFKDNRATLHLHGGISPWISDGTPHQWITPANENTPWPEGVSVKSVPDMISIPGVPSCSAATDGCMSFYYTNQQSARLMFYHDHSWGITRLNVYAGEAAGYLISDDTEKKLLPYDAINNPTGLGLIPGPADTIPLVIQDRTFVPAAAQTAALDPTWDYTRWGKEGDLWYHHVYMPAQNPGDPGGMSGYGRWMYGPWFWPPAKPPYGPIPNPYYNMDPKGPDGIRGTADDFSTPLAVPCNLANPATWQYQTDPFCEPVLMPGAPNISVGMEQFNDTPIVNGTAYPTHTVEPKAYRLRILNAANDRFFNLQWYVADATGTEVALDAALVAAAQTDPVVFPTPDTTKSPAGPAWIQIGSEGGFLPAPVVVKNQPTTWITDPTRFDVGNVDLHALLLAPAERADVIVDFSQFAGKTLILYNDAPAAFPARVPSYDYYTGYPDQWPVGPQTIVPGYGPNTRTIMQIVVSGSGGVGTPDYVNPTMLANLEAAFAHQADGSGVFESGQHPIIVGQAAYNSAYGTSFSPSSWCNVTGVDVPECDGFARIFDQGGDLFYFNPLFNPLTKLNLKVEPKALHDEMNAVAFDEFGRMTANIGLEATPAAPGVQNVILYPYVNPPTEFIDGTNLPTNLNVTPITTQDGSQIWKITHNGVDTHPIHFHLYDVQVLNRVTWDNIIIPPEASELGWKDTVRISPLEDTIVALRPVIPTLPFELPNSIRTLSPMMIPGATAGFENTDVHGDPLTTPIVNQLVNFGQEYVYHCHILSHEEMDMMRPVSLAVPPFAADGLAYTITGTGNNRRVRLTWNDNSINETAFVVQRTTNGTTWTNVGTILSPLDQPNIHQLRVYVDPTSNAATAYQYRVVAQNAVGYGGALPSLTVTSTSATLGVNPPAPPTSLTATFQAGPQVSLTWRDNATNETGFVIERSTDGVTFSQIATAPARANTGNVTYIDTTIIPGATYTYRVAAVNVAGTSAYSNPAAVPVPAVPAAPGNLTAANGPNGGGNSRSVILTWQDLSNNETGFTLQRATNATFTSGLTTINIAVNSTTYTNTGLSRNTQYWYRIRANNGAIITSAWVNATPFPILTNP